MRVVLAGLLLLVLAPQRAEAWADATVRSASARVTLDDHARAHVVIDATLRIEGGWLEALELDGLDEGLALDPLDPVTMATSPSADALAAGAAPEPLEPTVTLRDDGVVVLAFTRRRAPRRGDYVVHLAYDADLTHHVRADEAEGGGAHVDWTFPAWRHGLDSVRVEMLVPSGAHPVVAADDEIDVTSESALEGTRWTLTRAHLARTRDWPIDVAFPEGALAIHVERASVAAPVAPLATTQPPSRPPWHGAALLAIASLFVALRILRTPYVEARERIVLRALVPLPAPVRALAALALGATLMGAALVGRDAITLGALALALALLGRTRGPIERVPPRLGSFRHATPTLRRTARRAALVHRFGIDAWLDATTGPGLLVVLLFGAAASRVPVPALGAALVAVAIVLASSLDAPRIARPAPPLVALGSLLRLARRVRVSLDGPPVALMPVVHLDVEGVAQEARLRVVSTFPEGVLRADVVVASSSVLGARHALLVVTARGSAADLALSAEGRLETVAAGPARVARLVPIEPARLDAALARVIGAASAPAAEAPVAASAAA